MHLDNKDIRIQVWLIINHLIGSSTKKPPKEDLKKQLKKKEINLAMDKQKQTSNFCPTKKDCQSK